MPVKRPTAKYEDLSKRFYVREFDYQKQFSHLYAHRLAEMTALLQPLARKKWGEKPSIKKLFELREDQEDSCIIIGTIYKHQVYKPSILREISEENQLAPQPQRLNYSDPEDKIILEDELQRVRLFGKVVGDELATGVVCAILGNIEEDGRFCVDDWLFYESGPQRPLALQAEQGQRLLVLACGLDQVQAYNFVDALNMFQHWLGGNIGDDGKSLLRLIICGNSVRSSPERRVPSLQTRNSEPSDTLDAVRSLDEYFAVWSRSLPIDVMPGAFDPANFMLPQQPFHNCMFPLAAPNASFQAVPNPYSCRLDETLITGCSGQNISDLLRSTHFDDPLKALRSTLIWSHLAPTAPDTLSCYPYLDSDPLIMRECPHIYFAGNFDKFDTDLHVGADGQRTRLVCVPSFSRTKSVIVVDLQTLDCRQVSFDVESE